MNTLPLSNKYYNENNKYNNYDDSNNTDDWQYWRNSR